MNYKTLLSFLASFLLCFSFSFLSAQPGQFQGQLNTMRFNNEMQFQNQMWMQMMNMRGVNASGGECEFLVIFKDSTKLKVTSAMYRDSATKKRFVIFIDKKYGKKDTNRYKKIYPSQTLSIKDNSYGGNRANADMFGKGVPNDTCWTFKVMDGPITVYSYLSMNGLMGTFDNTSITGLQSNNGPVVAYSDDKLKQMLSSDSTASVYFQKKKVYKAVKKFNSDAEKGQ